MQTIRAPAEATTKSTSLVIEVAGDLGAEGTV